MDLSKSKDRQQHIDFIFKGLSSSNKYLSSKYFYDQKGSKIFKDITMLAEYYPTRTEKKILRQAGEVIFPNIKDADIIELGSGDCSKISILIENISFNNRDSVNYVPVDISRSALIESAEELLEKFPGITVNAVAADFMDQIHLIPDSDKRQRVFCFLGSTLGNFSKVKARRFLMDLSSCMRSKDMLLLGLDMVKEKMILERAYNDSKDITEAFNKNILNAVNTIAATDFDGEDYIHRAFYNEEESRIEMHLQSKIRQYVSSPFFPQRIMVEEGETIHTENSHKFSEKQIHEIADYASFKIQRIFTDEKKWFSLVQLIKN